MDVRLAEWFGSGDTGLSSETIALWLSARVKNGWGPHTPSDPSDLGRCLRLLERIPEWKTRMAEMAECSEGWARMMIYWDEIAASMADEVGIDWSKGRSAPKTYEMMKQREKSHA
jgi:hypothetical protein